MNWEEIVGVCNNPREIRKWSMGEIRQAQKNLNDTRLRMSRELAGITHSVEVLRGYEMVRRDQSVKSKVNRRIGRGKL